MKPSIVDLQGRIVELERQLAHERETVMVLREFIRRSLNGKPIYHALQDTVPNPEPMFMIDMPKWFEEKCRD